MTNLAHITETALLILAAYLLGCAMGYGIRRLLHAGRATRAVEVIDAPVIQQAEPEPASDIRRPRPAARLAATVSDLPPPATVGTQTAHIALKAPRNGRADDLKQIKGIGPKIEASLHRRGIFHLDQIAAWSRADIAWVESELAFKGRVRRERWVEQAADLSRTKVSA